MALNPRFNPELEEIININPALANWFSKNQESMAYFNFTSHNNSCFENYSSLDIRALGKMSSIALYYLENKDLELTDQERADKAAKGISDLYNTEKDFMSESARSLYAISLTPQTTLKREMITEEN